MADLILLRWFDSAIGRATEVYTPQEAAQEGMIVLVTVGWLLRETTEPYGGYYTLAASKHGNANWRGIQVIPKANVIVATKLGPEEKA